jgi:hypothetical protein
MIRLKLAGLAVTSGLVTSFACVQVALAQPSAMKPMQDAQRKAEQKARESKKDDEQAQAHDKAHKQESAKPASSP